MQQSLTLDCFALARGLLAAVLDALDHFALHECVGDPEGRLQFAVLGQVQVYVGVQHRIPSLLVQALQENVDLVELAEETGHQPDEDVVEY